MLASTLLFFDISTGEIFIILMVLFMVFGPQRMPEIARKVGKAINKMKHATSELTKEFNEETGEIRKTFEDEAKDIRKTYNKTKKDIEKENKNLENELSIKTDMGQRKAKTNAPYKNNTEILEGDQKEENTKNE